MVGSGGVDLAVAAAVAAVAVEAAAAVADVDVVLLLALFSDGSDHRHCCHTSGVPRECLEWCRGAPVGGGGDGEAGTAFCALVHLRNISRCFLQGRDVLPGMPRCETERERERSGGV